MRESSGPVSVGIIMDGNRRWASSRGLSGLAGHRAGKEVLLSLLDDYRPLRERWGASHYTFYTFSTENWSRSQEEVAGLLGLFEHAFEEIRTRLPHIKADGVAIRFPGERERFSSRLQELIHQLEGETASGKDGTFAFALSYGGRADILQAANRLIEKEAGTITEQNLSSVLWTAGVPEPDLVIRTGGERRLSNFLTWQSVYSELTFTDTLWPDFNREELEKIFSNYASRERRRGK